MSTTPIKENPPVGFTPPSQRTGKLSCIINSYFINPLRYLWSPKPNGFSTWAPLARECFTTLSHPSRCLNASSLLALFAFLKKTKTEDSLPVKIIQDLKEAEDCLTSQLDTFRNDLKDGMTLIAIPVTTPPPEAGKLHYLWRSLLIAFLPLTVALFGIKQLFSLFRSFKADLQTLWTPGVGHISLLVIPVTKNRETVTLDHIEYFDSKGEEPPRFVHELSQALIPPNGEEPKIIHSEYQYQNDVNNCGFWIFKYLQLRSENKEPDAALTTLQAFSKTICIERMTFCKDRSLQTFFSTYSEQPKQDCVQPQQGQLDPDSGSSDDEWEIP
ncbi:MAG: hypothetical protein A2Y28_00475 [Chlamydiae bacterium GWC2_50_10]|nr:MAG: hypothetical protein A2Y28_00475 [Chlamydiae bacterium GWC2_50_10]HAZ15279.1 hypothetical protein [Parachlamydiales bacterium]